MIRNEHERTTMTAIWAAQGAALGFELAAGEEDTDADANAMEDGLGMDDIELLLAGYDRFVEHAANHVAQGDQRAAASHLAGAREMYQKLNHMDVDIEGLFQFAADWDRRSGAGWALSIRQADGRI